MTSSEKRRLKEEDGRWTRCVKECTDHAGGFDAYKLNAFIASEIRKSEASVLDEMKKLLDSTIHQADRPHTCEFGCVVCLASGYNAFRTSALRKLDDLIIKI